MAKKIITFIDECSSLTKKPITITARDSQAIKEILTMGKASRSLDGKS